MPKTQDPTETAEFVSAVRPLVADPFPGPIPRVEVDLAAKTHVGKRRPNNEDNYLVVRFGRFLETLATSLPANHVPERHEAVGYGMVVADGMGGMAAGELASRVAIRSFINLVLETPDWILGNDEHHLRTVLDRMAHRFRGVNEAVLEHAGRQPELSGMGTTLTLALNFGPALMIAHVGDSPIFLARRGQLHKLTRDHTLAAALRSATPSELNVASRFRHVLTNAIGIEGSGGQPDIDYLPLENGDRVLLCTDGLTDMVDDSTIGAALARDQPAEEVCQALIDRALERGGRDNVTVIVAAYRIEG